MVTALLADNQRLREENAQLRTEVEDLRTRLGQNSSNSSKPPSTDSPAEREGRREKRPSGKKRGGQPGHKGAQRHLLTPTNPVVLGWAMNIDRDETVIRGEWIELGGRTQADENCHRIEQLTGGYLKKIGPDASGWDVLYQDPSDGSYWELTYPQSELHGGGPPSLTKFH
jgi:hypothetical protein